MTSAHRVSSKWSSRDKLWCVSAARPTFIWAMSGASPSTHARVYKSHGTASPLTITFEPCVRTVLGPPYRRTKVSEFIPRQGSLRPTRSRGEGSQIFISSERSEKTASALTRSIYDVTARRQIEVAIPSFDSRFQRLWEKHSDGRTGRERNGSDEQAVLHDHRVPCSRTTNIRQGKQCSHRSKGKSYLLTFSIVSHSRHEMCMKSHCKSIDELIFSKDAYVFT